jgi:predicted RND superfamily exporter protein
MLLIPIQVISDLGVAASVGVAVIILTNLLLLPVLLSYWGIGERAARRLQQRRQAPGRIALFRRCSQLAGARAARVSLLVATAGFALGLLGGQQLAIGDLDQGAPELRPDSRYNRDSRFISAHYATSADVLVVMVETPPQECTLYRHLEGVDRFVWHMENVPGVNSTLAATSISRLVAAGYNEGNLKWATITRNQRLLGSTFDQVPEALMNTRCSLLPVILFLDDHKAQTLARVVDAVRAFARDNDGDGLRFVLAAGNAGIEAATNEEIGGARIRMMLLIYGAVCALVLASFRSWRAVVCIVTPLALTSVLCQALMAQLGIGVKVATLPVIALGVGVGVDYGIYIFSRLDHFLRLGQTLQEAYFNTLRSTGEAVALTGAMLAVGVATWIGSPIKFQADMGMLLTFMFLWNMVGSLWLLPALAHVLLPGGRRAGAPAHVSEPEAAA